METTLRVLVVDDYDEAAELLGRLVEKIGHTVARARDGEEALRVGVEFQPDVVIMDITMPGMDGYETAAAMRKTPWGGIAHLAALTGWSGPEDIQRAKDAGFDSHLEKPTGAAELRALFEAIHRHADEGANGVPLKE